MSRTVVITGGSKGIGWEIARTFALNGYKVISGSRTVRENLPSEVSSGGVSLIATSTMLDFLSGAQLMRLITIFSQTFLKQIYLVTFGVHKLLPPHYAKVDQF